MNTESRSLVQNISAELEANLRGLKVGPQKHLSLLQGRISSESQSESGVVVDRIVDRLQQLMLGPDGELLPAIRQIKVGPISQAVHPRAPKLTRDAIAHSILDAASNRADMWSEAIDAL